MNSQTPSDATQIARCCAQAEAPQTARQHDRVRCSHPHHTSTFLARLSKMAYDTTDGRARGRKGGYLQTAVHFLGRVAGKH
eukprot:477434-Pleurochrysis_carterae.AAC.1